MNPRKHIIVAVNANGERQGFSLFAMSMKTIKSPDNHVVFSSREHACEAIGFLILTYPDLRSWNVEEFNSDSEVCPD